MLGCPIADPVADRIVRHALQRPEAPALLWGTRTVTYGELVALAETVRARLLSTTPELAPVAMASRKTPEAVAVVLGCLLARRPVLLPSADLAQLPRDALVKATGATLLPDPDLLIGEKTWRPATPRHGYVEGTHIPEDTAFLLTTSGSTGTPKAVPVGHGAVARFAEWAAHRFEIDARTTVLNHAPLNFDLCLLDVWTTLSRGGQVVLVDQEQATRPTHLLDLVHRTQVHVLQGVPLLFKLLAVGAEQTDSPPLTSVRHVLITGDVMPANAFAPLPGLFPAARLHNVYGCTETNDSFVHDIDPADPMPHGTLPLGAPVEGGRACLVTEEGIVLAGAGVGELLVSTPFQAHSYAETAKNEGVFVDAPLGEDRTVRWYRTGDLARRHADGTLTLEGRRDHQVKVRGVRVNTAEVEAVIRAHHAVEDAVVLAVDDPLAGKRLHAIAQHRADTPLNALVLRGHMAASLSRVAIPASIDLTTTPLPRTSTGKPDRTALRQHLTPHRPVPGTSEHPDKGA